jgi:hypothetical protein
MLIAPSNFLRVQAAMHNVSGQTIPQTPPSGLACMISAAERRMSEIFPTRAAMMKSAGEQLAGQASLQGFSSQYSHRNNSVWSCACDMISESILSFSTVNLYLKVRYFERIIPFLYPVQFSPLRQY